MKELVEGARARLHVGDFSCARSSAALESPSVLEILATLSFTEVSALAAVY